LWSITRNHALGLPSDLLPKARGRRVRRLRRKHKRNTNRKSGRERQRQSQSGQRIPHRHHLNNSQKRMAADYGHFEDGSSARVSCNGTSGAAPVIFRLESVDSKLLLQARRRSRVLKQQPLVRIDVTMRLLRHQRAFVEAALGFRDASIATKFCNAAE
jgi:hypothetical protein